MATFVTAANVCGDYALPEVYLPPASLLASAESLLERAYPTIDKTTGLISTSTTRKPIDIIKQSQQYGAIAFVVRRPG